VPSPPTASSNPAFTLQQVTTFKGASFPANMEQYGDAVLAPGGYIATSHLVLTGSALEVQGYVDPVSGSVGGVTGAGFDLSEPVADSGGFDVCVSLSSGDWGGVHLVLISWPADNTWGEGENDFFEGNPATPDINVHEIGSSPQTNVWQGTWPAAVGAGAHVVGARWDPADGYLFYLDGTLIGTGAPSATVKVPTTPHHLAIQMQDIGENSTAAVTATIYWTARYSYP
jgi:hypothetical protein